MTGAAPRILMVSNGFGEMAILQSIAEAIARREPAALVRHMPLVGVPPPDAWPPAVGPRKDMPSGGLVTYWNVRNMARDIGAGLLGTTLAQFRYLWTERGCYDVAVAVGDVYCAAACLWFARLPTVFVATAKSEYVAGHSAIERAIARRARITFARDQATADALRSGRVDARYVGNVMMDAVARAEQDIALDERALRIAVLPGSRSDAPANGAAAMRRLRRIAALSGRNVQAFVALAPAADAQAVMRAMTEAAPVLVTRDAGAQPGVEVRFLRGALGAVLRAAHIVLGQAGTGNEQAAGLGKPVVAAAAPGESPQNVGWYRMRQQKLLGDALLVAPADDDAFARAVVDLLDDPPRMSAMAAAGRARMGAPGASEAIASAVLDIGRERPRERPA